MKENKTDWLQSGTVQLTQPIVASSSKIIDESVTLTAELRLEGVEIYFTADGSEPNQESDLYTQPIEVVPLANQITF